MDLFCGAGGLSEGFRWAGFNVILGLDNEETFMETFAANHEEAKIVCGDIRKISVNEVKKMIKHEKVDVIVGGPPCQGFSSLRPYRASTIEDERNDLYMAFALFVDFFRPKVVVMENVVGLITHNSGHTLDKILDRFESLGYAVDWRILNAASYGVPEKRERFIMIATRNKSAVRFPAPTHYFSGRVIGHKDKGRYILADTNHPKALSVNDAISDLPPLSSGQQAHEYDREPETPYQRDRRSGSTKLTLHKAANHNDKMLEVIKHAGENINFIPKHLITSGFSSCYSRLSGNDPSTTITVKFQSPASSKCIHPTQDRTITPREAARIQSFDDSFIFKGSITQICGQIGNAVPPLLGRAIASTVSQLLNQTGRKTINYAITQSS
ncbi:MAG: DNA (cytosine-5-)-methyltransferase [Hadesarchaea archaeon]|nr:DNA (cytosine-5-)-methyltransferase [Hadesarchaea archaeon]